MLNISIDAAAISAKPTGVGLYAANLIQELYALQSTENFNLNIVYQPRFKQWLKLNFAFPASFKNYSPQSLSLLPLPVRLTDLLVSLPFKSAINQFAKYYYHNHNLKSANVISRPDIVHGTAYAVYPCPQSLKVMTIHDLAFMKYPEYLTKVSLDFHRNRVKNCLKWTDLIITVSESSKQDIVNYLNFDPQKVYVTPLASRYDDAWRQKIQNQAEFLKSQTHYDFRQPYILFVSTIEPRKNIAGIISAFNLLKNKYQVPHQLVLIGQNGWKSEPIFAAMANSRWTHEIHHLKYLSDELLALFYSQASVFLYPSYYEGFGLPVLEAMNWGTPVITSNISSLPEVVGDAGIMIDPYDIHGICEGLWQIIGDQELSDNLSHRSLARAKLFSWQKTAQETLRAYKTILPS